MELLPILLLLSIFVITACVITTCDEEVNKSFCGLCGGHFRLYHKIDFKEIDERCKKVEKGYPSFEKSCAAFKKLSEETREEMKKKLEKLTWKKACTEICKHRIRVYPPHRLNRRG